MIKKILFCLVLVLFSFSLFAQTGTIKGVVKDHKTGETLIGVNIVYAEGKGTVTDINGNYSIDLPNGEYNLKVSYVGYKTKNKKVILNSKTARVDFQMKTTMLTEVEVVADIASTRETPVAFTNVTPIQLEEELASRDLPMILNRTPGVYATQQGGGDGDSRINIRGFNQRNVAVMIDGIPVNDMENGWVYWSNWFGLDAVIRQVQVQRGLGASKLAIPAVGGTMNIITKGISNKREISLKQEVANDGYMRTSLGINTGQLKNGWGVTFAGSYKKGDGWVDQTYTEGWFYFLRIDKKIGNHIISLSGMGAPQEHGQKPYKKPIALFDKDLAGKLGVDTTNTSYFNGNINNETMVDKGSKYNPHWGYVRRYGNIDGDTSNTLKEALNERVNYYHKPMFSLRDFWNVNNKLYISNIAYLSIGSGGGTRVRNTLKPIDYDDNGQINWQRSYNANYFGPFNIDDSISLTEHKSGQYIRSLRNNHFWYGLLSTFTYNLNEKFTISGGIDLRSYTGEHYTEVYDLLGGDYCVDQENKNQESKVKRVGDKIIYHNDGLVKWGGIFGQVEYNVGRITSFINLSLAYSGNKRIDYFKKRMLEIDGTTVYVGDTVDGQIITRNTDGVKDNQTDWEWFPGYTVKGGLNYNLSETSNVFVNLGYISKAPRFNNIFDYENKLFLEIKNEIIKAFEMGYSFNNANFTLNVNGYLTFWENKPVDRAFTVTITDTVTQDPIEYSANINGINAFHKGIEIEFAHKLGEKIIWERLLSIGDWKWDSGDSVYIYDDDHHHVDTKYFNAKGVHVGDAAQIQYAERIRWEIVKDVYIKGSATYFAKHYAEFDPLSLTDDNPKESWLIPSYILIDLHAGYTYRYKKMRFDLRASVLNLLDELYISDAMNNDSYSTNIAAFNAQSAGVFIGLGRRFNTSLRITF